MMRQTMGQKYKKIIGLCNLHRFSLKSSFSTCFSDIQKSSFLTWSCAAQKLWSSPQTRWSSGRYIGYYQCTETESRETWDLVPFNVGLKCHYNSFKTARLTWLISLVQAAFSWREGAKRTTEEDWPSGGSTTILNSRWLKPWPAALSAMVNMRSTSQLTASIDVKKQRRLGSIWFGIKDTHSPRHWHLVLQWECTISETALLPAVGGEKKKKRLCF